MDSESNKTHVPWSRHMGNSKSKIDPRKQQESTSNRPTNSYESRRATLATRIKAISESDLCFDGKNKRDREENNWDSQSDPGSISPRNTRPLNNITLNVDLEKNGYERTTEGGTGHKKAAKKPVQGRGVNWFSELRRRKLVRNIKGNRTNQNEDVVVEIPVVTTPAKVGHDIPKYMQSYLNFMYYSCMTPHKWDGIDNREQTKCQHVLSIIQKIMCCYITIMATFTSISLIKWEVLSFVVERDLNHFIDIGYVVVSGTMHWYLIYFLTFRNDAISKILETWNQHENPKPTHSAESKNATEWLPVISGLVTILMAVLKAVAYTEFENWSLQELIFDSSEDIANGVFIWKPNHLCINSTLEEATQPRSDIATIWIGILGITANICWNFQIDCFKDCLIWVAIVNRHHVLNFCSKIKESLSQKKVTKRNSEVDDDQCWEAYRELQEVSSVTNSTFFAMLIINNLNSFMVLSYFLTQVLNKEVRLRVLIFVGYNVFKGTVSYFPARISSGQNDLCRKWIQSLPCETKRFRVDDTPYTREVMLLELEKEPLGLGRGKVHISNEFLVTFITLVASLFCFLLNIDPKNEVETLLY